MVEDHLKRYQYKESLWNMGISHYKQYKVEKFTKEILDYQQGESINENYRVNNSDQEEK